VDQALAVAAARNQGAITAVLHYGIETGVKPASEYYGPGNIHHRRVLGTFEERSVQITNGRPLASKFSLDRNGFAFVRHGTAVTDFFDGEQIASVYYAELERLVTGVSGAFRAVAYDHTLRSADKDEREARLAREPVLYAHNDYTEGYAPRRLRELLPEILPEEAEALMENRFAIIQVWRPIGTVRADPLAIADARSVRAGDLLPSDRRLPDRVVENYRLTYNPDHRWFYFPAMQHDEVIMFKTFDSATDGRARFTPHAAFKDPNSPADAPHRRSIEARLFAFFDDTPKRT
jgi:hypothetical protein